MMRLVLFGSIAFVLGIAGGTGFFAMRPPAKAAAGADSLRAASPDSAAMAHEPAAALSPTASTTAVGTEPPAAPEHGAVAPTAANVAAPAAVSVSLPAAGRERPDPIVLDGGALADSCRAVAKILATMKPADAAKIMNHLSDDQVEGILRASGARQAGVFMAQLPPERAATMSRRFITRPQGNGK